jgi:hypothetical protein
LLVVFISITHCQQRDIAAKSTQFIDFADLNLNELPQDIETGDEKSVSTFDSRSEKERSEEQSEPTVDKKSFLKKMYKLSQRKLWVETVSRRSSVLYHKERCLTNEEIQKKFLEVVSEGVQVRRHQANKFAEKVSLFGRRQSPDSDTLTSVIWEPEVSHTAFTPSPSTSCHRKLLEFGNIFRAGEQRTRRCWMKMRASVSGPSATVRASVAVETISSEA